MFNGQDENVKRWLAESDGFNDMLSFPISKRGAENVLQYLNTHLSGELEKEKSVEILLLKGYFSFQLNRFKEAKNYLDDAIGRLNCQNRAESEATHLRRLLSQLSIFNLIAKRRQWLRKKLRGGVKNGGTLGSRTFLHPEQYDFEKVIKDLRDNGRLRENTSLLRYLRFQDTFYEIEKHLREYGATLKRNSSRESEVERLWSICSSSDFHDIFNVERSFFGILLVGGMAKRGLRGKSELHDPLRDLLASTLNQEGEPRFEELREDLIEEIRDVYTGVCQMRQEQIEEQFASVSQQQDCASMVESTVEVQDQQIDELRSIILELRSNASEQVNPSSVPVSLVGGSISRSRSVVSDVEGRTGSSRRRNRSQRSNSNSFFAGNRSTSIAEEDSSGYLGCLSRLTSSK